MKPPPQEPSLLERMAKELKKKLRCGACDATGTITDHDHPSHEDCNYNDHCLLTTPEKPCDNCNGTGFLKSQVMAEYEAQRGGREGE